MTPLEMALKKKERGEHCNDTTMIDGILYCNKNGKIIHPFAVENGKCAINKCRNLENVYLPK